MEIVEVSTRAHFRDFLQVPFQLHQDDPNWVPPLHATMKKIFDPKNPFFKTATLKSWVAYRNSKPIGRISGIINEAHNRFHQENIAFWGFFESENHVATATALFKAVEQWAASHQLTSLRGPMNPSTNHDCGLQISAFDTRPFVLMPQNPSFYVDLVEKQDFKKVKDLHAWRVTSDEAGINLDTLQMLEEIQETTPISIRNINMRNFQSEIKILFDIYNDAWEANWGFVPLTIEEFFYMANELKAIFVAEGIFILEVDEEPAAFCIGLPDVNQALIHLRNGKLFPTGWLKLLWHTKIKKTITQGRIITLGIKKKYQHLPLGALIYNQCMQALPKLGYHTGECSWVLEDNRPMRSALRMINATHYKTYRIYEKNLMPV